MQMTYYFRVIRIYGLHRNYGAFFPIIPIV